MREWIDEIPTQIGGSGSLLRVFSHLWLYQVQVVIGISPKSIHDRRRSTKYYRYSVIVHKAPSLSEAIGLIPASSVHENILRQNHYLLAVKGWGFSRAPDRTRVLSGRNSTVYWVIVPRLCQGCIISYTIGSTVITLSRSSSRLQLSGPKALHHFEKKDQTRFI